MNRSWFMRQRKVGMGSQAMGRVPPAEESPLKIETKYDSVAICRSVWLYVTRV